MVVAILALAALAVLPGVAAAQSPPPPVVGGVQITTTTAPPIVQAEFLPRTGSDLFPTVLAAVGLLLVGTVLVVSVRRRNGGGPKLA